MKLILTAMSAALILSGCARAVLNPREYVSWVEDESNGLMVQKQIGGHSFELQYKPTEYEVLMHNSDELISEADLNTMTGTIDDLQYFTLTIVTSDHKEVAQSGLSDENEYSNRVTYMLSEMQYDFELIEGSDTLPCVFFHAERSFNISPESHFLLAFEKRDSTPESVTNKTLYYTDRLLDCGPVLITIKAEDIENIPELKFPD